MKPEMFTLTHPCGHEIRHRSMSPEAFKAREANRACLACRKRLERAAGRRARKRMERSSTYLILRLLALSGAPADQLEGLPPSHRRYVRLAARKLGEFGRQAA
jgi:hypothetical protein